MLFSVLSLFVTSISYFGTLFSSTVRKPSGNHALLMQTSSKTHWHVLRPNLMRIH